MYAVKLTLYNALLYTIKKNVYYSLSLYQKTNSIHTPMYRIKYLILNVVNLSLYVNYHFLETRKKHQKEPKRGYIPPMYRDKCIEIEKSVRLNVCRIAELLLLKDFFNKNESFS